MLFFLLSLAYWWCRSDIILNFKDDSFMAMIINPDCLPAAEIQALSQFLKDATRINPATIPGSSDAPKYRFPAIHMVWTNRYSELVSAGVNSSSTLSV